MHKICRQSVGRDGVHMKRHTIYAMVTVFAAVMLCSCAGTESGAEMQTGTSVVTSAATTSATTSEKETASFTTTASETTAEETTTVPWYESKDDKNAEFVYNPDGSIEYLGPCEPTSKLPEGEAGKRIKRAMEEANLKTHGCFAYNDLDRDGSFELFVLLPAKTSYSYSLVFVNDSEVTLLEEHVLGIDRMSAGTQVFYASVGLISMAHTQPFTNGCYTYYGGRVIDVSKQKSGKEDYVIGFVSSNILVQGDFSRIDSGDACYLLYWDGDSETLRPYKTERLTSEQLVALNKDDVVAVKNPELIVRRKDVVHLSEKDDTAPEGVKVTTYIIENEKITRKYDRETNYDVDHYGVYYEDYPIYEVE